MSFVLAPLFWLLRWALALLLLCFAVAAVRTAFAPLAEPAAWSGVLRAPALWAGLAGLAVRRLLVIWRREDPLELVDTLEHELTHAVIGTLTLAPPVSLTATLRGGGEVELRRSNPLAALAPYCLPLYAFALALLSLILKPEWSLPGRLASAFLLGSFAHRLLREFHFGQSDFRAFGFVFSMVFIAAALPLCLIGVADLARIADIEWTRSAHLFLAQVQALPGRIPQFHGPGW